MIASNPEFPPPANEAEWSFAPGSVAAAQLSLALQRRDIVEIPTVIGGQRLYSREVEEIRAPHDRATSSNLRFSRSAIHDTR